MSDIDLAKILYSDLTGVEGLVVVGPDGKPWTLEALSAWWGAEIGVIEPAEDPRAGHVARVVELRVLDGPATQIVRVMDDRGFPVPGVGVARWWADAPVLPPLPPDCEATYLYDRAVVGSTGASGDVGFGMGRGDLPGSSAVWVVHCDAPSGGVVGLGWKPAQQHATIIVTLRIESTTAPPPPEPPGECPVDEVLTAMDQIESHVVEVRALFEASPN